MRQAHLLQRGWLHKAQGPAMTAWQYRLACGVQWLASSPLLLDWCSACTVYVLALREPAMWMLTPHLLPLQALKEQGDAPEWVDEGDEDERVAALLRTDEEGLSEAAQRRVRTSCCRPLGHMLSLCSWILLSWSLSTKHALPLYCLPMGMLVFPTRHSALCKFVTSATVTLPQQEECASLSSIMN